MISEDWLLLEECVADGFSFAVRKRAWLPFWSQFHQPWHWEPHLHDACRLFLGCLQRILRQAVVPMSSPVFSIQDSRICGSPSRGAARQNNRF